MRISRRHFSASQKAQIARRHISGNQPVSSLADEDTHWSRGLVALASTNDSRCSRRSAPARVADRTRKL